MQQFPNASQMMIVVLRGKVQMIHQPHRLLQTRMQHGSSKQCRIDRLHPLHQPQSRLPKLSEDFIERARIVIRFMRFAILQVGRC